VKLGLIGKKPEETPRKPFDRPHPERSPFFSHHSIGVILNVAVLQAE